MIYHSNWNEAGKFSTGQGCCLGGEGRRGCL